MIKNNPPPSFLPFIQNDKFRKNFVFIPISSFVSIDFFLLSLFIMKIFQPLKVAEFQNGRAYERVWVTRLLALFLIELECNFILFADSYAVKTVANLPGIHAVAIGFNLLLYVVDIFYGQICIFKRCNYSLHSFHRNSALNTSIINVYLNQQPCLM